jgi:hypothetical protein
MVGIAASASGAFATSARQETAASETENIFMERYPNAKAAMPAA